MIHRFAADGTMLADVAVGIAVAGLAYNPATQHLFVVESAEQSKVYVLDVAHDYAVIGQFYVGGLAK